MTAHVRIGLSYAYTNSVHVYDCMYYKECVDIYVRMQCIVTIICADLCQQMLKGNNWYCTV